MASGHAIIEKLVEQHLDQAEWKQDLTRFDVQIAGAGAEFPENERGESSST